MGRPFSSSDPYLRPSLRDPKLELLKVVPEAPPGLGTVGKGRWTELCGLLLGSNALYRPFLPMVEAACWCYEVIATLRTEIESAKRNNTVTVRTGCTRKPHPAIKEMAVQQTLLHKYLTSLGMSPASRRAMNLPVTGDPENEKPNQTGVTGRPTDIDDEFDE